MHRQRARMAVFTVLAILASLLTLVSPAQAAESVPTLKWSPTPTIGADVYDVYTSPTGSATLPCTNTNGGSNTITYSATGALIRELDRTTMIDGANNCITKPAVSKDGDVYGIPWKMTTGGYGPNLLAYDGNTLKWKYPASCGSSSAQVVVGADGNIYATTYGRLIGLTPEVATGQTQPTKVLDVTIPNDCSIMLQSYKDGLVLHGQNSGNARYYSYSGKFLGQATIGDVWAEKVNADGKLFVGGFVSGSYTSGKVMMYDPRTGQVEWTTIASTPGANVNDVQVYPVSGGVVAKMTEQKMISGIPASPTQYITTLAVLNASGGVTKSMQLSNTYSQNGTTGVYGNIYPVAVSQGKLAVVREMRLDTGISYPSTVPAIYIGVYDIANDSWSYQQVMSGDLAKAGGPSGFYLNTTNQFGVANNILYLSVKCSGNCSTNTPKLYALDIGGLGLDYPRGEVLARSPRPSALYIACCDSFSSGEGVSPFEAGTDIPGVNMCHRSNVAYPRLIAGTSPKIPSLGTSGFRACSGAVTTNVTDLEQWNESIQLDWWPDTTTQLVTVMVGGNDAKFTELATACVLTTCQVGSAAYAASLNEINNNLGTKLEATYKRILQYAPNAQIYVVDYPQVVAAKSPSSPYDIRCGYMYNQGPNLTGSPYYPWEDTWAARDIVTKLDAKISSSVTSVRGLNADYFARLHYISTNDSTQFPGHAACDAYPSYFNNIDQWPGHPAYVFHPNADGQGAYAIVVSSAINAS